MNVLCFSTEYSLAVKTQADNSSILQKYIFFCFKCFRQIFPTSCQIFLRCPVALRYMGSHHGGGTMRWKNKELSSQMANLKKKIMKLEHQVKIISDYDMI